ncbi:MAG: 16S rRNA (cytosine(967)-C(5))-methyltransferase RsmB [Clostridia bacterium]|nr:16S rRNA (cytosine(967)-C(5))-methyltransferase RsmB [Clostridia bacterium]
MLSAREVALKTLIEAEKNNSYSNLLLNAKLNELELNELDKKLLTELVYGVISYKLTLDFIISKFSKIKLNKISVPILNILRLGIYQLYYLTKIPVSATVNESVKLAKKYGHTASSGYVNAILRNVSKTEFNSLFDGIDDVIDRLSKKYSYPYWMVKMWVEKLGEEDAEKLLIAGNKKAYDSIRVNTLKITRDELISKLKAEGFDVEKGAVQDIIYTRDIRKLLNHKYFLEGLFTVQDESPSLVAHILNPKENDKVLDMCASPGGKTTHIAELMNNKGEIIALELYEKRAKLVEDLAARLGITNIKVYTKDATIFEPDFENKFDKVLTDVPCSGLGVIRKKPDIKWNTEYSDIEEIAKTQYKILENAARYVKENGIIVYSTCTNTDVENEGMIEKFIKEHANFCIEHIDVPEKFLSGIKNTGTLELYPYIEGADGFFICILKKLPI